MQIQSAQPHRGTNVPTTFQRSQQSEQRLDTVELATLTRSNLPHPLQLQDAEPQIDSLDRRLRSCQLQVELCKSRVGKIQDEFPPEPSSALGKWLKGRIPLLADSQEESARKEEIKQRHQEALEKLEAAREELRMAEDALLQDLHSLYPQLAAMNVGLDKGRVYHAKAREIVYGPDRKLLAEAERLHLLAEQEVTSLQQSMRQEGGKVSEGSTHVAVGHIRVRKRNS
ncbi:hypothetical protein DYH09_11370 [bacterium CPR1]|nr:hypothetical protein [bacterium CPR1]